MIRIGALRCIPYIRSHCSSVIPMMSAYPMMPALLMRTSIRPLRSLAAETIRSGASGAVTSATTVAAPCPISRDLGCGLLQYRAVEIYQNRVATGVGQPGGQGLADSWPAPVTMRQ